MKETVNVNIGSQAFTLDEDAYRVLRSYLDDIRSRLPEYDTETMGDIEVRIAEIFREIVSSPMRVITLDTVRTAMHRMGAPSDFGERRGNTARQEDEEAEPETRKLYRSRTDRSIAGICGGLADFFHVDATVMRLLMLFLIIFGGLSIWAYIIPPRNSILTVKTDKTMATDKTKKLYRVRDGIIAGVCGGLADFFGLDPSLIRIATLILILFGGLSLWVYIILWLIVPKAPKRLTE